MPSRAMLSDTLTSALSSSSFSQSQQSCSSFDGSDASTIETSPETALGYPDLTWLDPGAVTQAMPWDLGVEGRSGMSDPSACDPITSGLQRVEELISYLWEVSKCSLNELKTQSQTIASEQQRRSHAIDMLKTINKTTSQILDVQVRTADHSTVATEQRRQIYDRFQTVENNLATTTKMVSDALSISNARMAQLEAEVSRANLDVRQTKEALTTMLQNIQASVDALKPTKTRTRQSVETRKRRRSSPTSEPQIAPTSSQPEPSNPSCNLAGPPAPHIERN